MPDTFNEYKPEKFTEVTKVSYRSRITNSFKGMVVGFILFVASFVLLYWNEDRTDLSSIAKTATEIASDVLNTDPSLNGKLVSITGIVNSDQLIGDNLFLKPGRYIAVERKVEMYAWVEKVETESKIEAGGSETIEKTYTYHKEWTEEPRQVFKYPQGHKNPQKTFKNYTNKVAIARIGVYNFDPQTVTLPPFSKLPLNEENITLERGAILVEDFYLFLTEGKGGTFGTPEIGNLRISYNVFHSDFEGTIFGKLNENRIDSYLDQAGNRLYRIFPETRESAITTLHKEYKTSKWIFRIIGFLMMWGGLVTLFIPISIVLDIIPTVGALSRYIISIITFITTFILTIITIFVSILLRSPIILIIIVLMATAGILITFFYFFKNKKLSQLQKTISNFK